MTPGTGRGEAAGDRYGELPHERLLLPRSDAACATPPPWLAASYAHFVSQLGDPGYPCFLGGAALRQHHLYCTVADAARLPALPRVLQRFLRGCGEAPGERRNLTIFFEPDTPPLSIDAYRERFWSFLAYLRAHDPLPWPPALPTDTEDAGWEFAFAGQGLFVFCAAPCYRRRRSRNLGPGMVLLMQPRSSFFGLDGHTAVGQAVRRVTRERLQAWDGMLPHADLGSYGDADNREWKQYMLPDDEQPLVGRCPFHAARDGEP